MEMMSLRKKGQAQILDGLLLLLITAICAVSLINIAGNYGRDASEKYDVIYRQKMAQNALLSLYHITAEKKSIMVDVSQDLAIEDYSLTNSGWRIKLVLQWYHNELGWHFGFAFPDLGQPSYITTDGSMDYDSFLGYPKRCASAALTYPCQAPDCCAAKGVAGDMCYEMFQVCVWQR